jgi:Spy/CpxP family protein refolding chaperone
MARHFAWILVVGLSLAAASAGATPRADVAADGVDGNPSQKTHEQDKDKQGEQRRPRFVKWWAEAEYRTELGISDQQSAAIEQIFQAHLPAQRQRYRELETLEPALAKLLKEGTADPDVVARAVDRVESLTAEVRKSRISTLYRMQHELTAEQRTRLKAIDERRRQADSRKSPDTDRRH